MDTVHDVDLGLRERKKRETRAALSREAIRLTVERGWDRVTVEDIAAAANVSARTFRNYFASKAEAVAAAHLDRMLRIADTLRARPATEPLWDAVGNAALVQFELSPEPAPGSAVSRDQRWLDGVRLVLSEPAVQGEVLKANAIAAAALARAIAARTGVDATRDVYPHLVAAVVVAANAVAVEHWLRTDPLGSVVPVLRDVFDQLAAGLPVP